MLETLLQELDGKDRNADPAAVAAEINAAHTSLRPDAWVTDRTMDTIIGPTATAAIMMTLEDVAASGGVDGYNAGRWIARLKGDGIDLGSDVAQQTIATLAQAVPAIADAIPALKQFATTRSAMLTQLGRDVTADDVTEGWTILARRASAAAMTAEANAWLAAYGNRHAAYLAALSAWVETGEGATPDVGAI